MNPTPEEREKRFSEIPQDVWHVFSSIETSKKIFEICKKNGLHIDQYGIVTGIIGEVLTGWLSTKEIIPLIVEETGTTTEIASAVTKEVSEQVFEPIRESLKNLESKYLGGNVEEVALTKEEILKHIENPVPLPLSGRRLTEDGRLKMEYGIIGQRGESGGQKMEDRGNADDALAQELENSVETEDEKGTSIPINKPKPAAEEPAPIKPQSILEKKLNTVTVTNANETPVDPYREPTA